MQDLWVLLWICWLDYTVRLPCNFANCFFPCWESSQWFQRSHLTPVGAQWLWQLTACGFWWCSHAYIPRTEDWDWHVVQKINMTFSHLKGPCVSGIVPSFPKRLGDKFIVYTCILYTLYLFMFKYVHGAVFVLYSLNRFSVLLNYLVFKNNMAKISMPM